MSHGLHVSGSRLSEPEVKKLGRALHIMDHIVARFFVGKAESRSGPDIAAFVHR